MKSNRTPQILITLLLILFSLSILHADTSSEKEESSEKPACAVCTANGNPMKVGNLDLWSKHNGKTYYFCNEDCKAKFNQNPEAYMPPVLLRTLPKFVLEDLKGKEVTLEKYEGKVMLLDFWATWCKPCVEAIPELKKLHEELGKDKKFVVVGISVDVGKDAKKKVKKFHIPSN